MNALISGGLLDIVDLLDPNLLNPTSPTTSKWPPRFSSLHLSSSISDVGRDPRRWKPNGQTKTLKKKEKEKKKKKK